MSSHSFAEGYIRVTPIDYITYELVCPNAVIAEHLYQFLSSGRCSCAYKNPSLMDNIVRFKHNVPTVSFTQCRQTYESCINELGKSQQIDIVKDKTEIISIIMHIHFPQEGLAGYIYNAYPSIETDSNLCFICNDDYQDLILEDNETIRLTCRTWKGVKEINHLLSNLNRKFWQEQDDKKIMTQESQSNNIQTHIIHIIWSIGLSIIVLNIITYCT